MINIFIIIMITVLNRGYCQFKVPKPLSTKGWSPWMPWDCPVTCGKGKGTRSRICEDADECQGPEEQTGSCAPEPCPVDPNAVNDELKRQIDQQLKTIDHTNVVRPGDAITLPCKGKLSAVLDREYPDAKVNWMRNGDLIYPDGKRLKLGKRASLTLNAIIEDNGVWWCSLALTPKMTSTVSFCGLGVQNQSPDITVEMGDSFELICRAKSLSRLVKSRMDQKWYHNSTVYKELKNVRPVDTDILKIKTSNYSDSGVWNCRYIESGFNLPPPARMWITSVFRVLVVPPRTFMQKLMPYLVALIVIFVLVIAVLWVYWKLLKRKEGKELEDEEEYEDEDEDEDEDEEADEDEGADEDLDEWDEEEPAD